ncbi:MAG: succinate dehydrogenase, cytochrome b556 subunit [Proteobacteria bacterium]|nr:succinate dehydrogenase, cytochrome b556 subunit [Pseudomonadota bacterium]
MKTTRPININPLTIRLPVMAFVSIMHRISGVLVFLLIPLLLGALGRSLASPEGLAQVKEATQTPLAQLFVWSLVGALIFHLFAGIRHLLMDMHIGDSLVAGRWGARIVILCALIAFIAAFWFWG